MAVRSLLLCVLLALAGFAPARSEPPAHQSATLADGTVVTLEGVTYGTEWRFGGMSVEPPPGTEAIVTDSTGNVYSGEPSNLYQPGLYPLTYYRSDSNESLKLGVWFHRTANATFAPQETVAMNNLPMRIGSYLRTPGTTLRRGEMTLEVSSIDEVECEGKRTMVKLNVYGGDPHLALMMQVRNERGKSANGIGPNEHAKWITGAMRAPEKFRQEEREKPTPHRCAEFMMDLPHGTSRITITIAINRAHYFEFMPTPNVLHDLPVR